MLLGDAEAVRVAGAVVIAGQEGAVLLAEAGIVVAGAGRYLGLALRDTGVKDPKRMAIKIWGGKAIRLRSGKL